MEELDHIFIEEKQQIVDMSLKLYRENLIVGTWGNLSMRVNHNDNEYYLVTPSGMEYEDTIIEDILVLDKDGKILSGKRRPTSELRMHMKLYEERSEINAIIHTHSTFATACAVVGIGIPMMVEDMIQHIGGNVRIAKYALPGTEELAENVCHAIEDRKAVLLKNHGALGMGVNLKDAYKSCVLIEKSAQILVYAKNLGHINLISTEDAELMVEYYNNQYGQKKYTNS
ncbi:MAG TPA: class II aldolase/adducin family protein [Clostridiaceae bacterium]